MGRSNTGPLPKIADDGPLMALMELNEEDDLPSMSAVWASRLSDSHAEETAWLVPLLCARS